jgi:type VI secretion system protein ImpK
MTYAATRDISLLREFEDFYSEVIRLRTRAELQYAEAAGGKEAEAEDNPAEAIWGRLADLLEKQGRFTDVSTGDIGKELYLQAQYVMVALADEVFLNTEWSGREYWTNHLLESHFFNSNIAGEQFFRRVDKLLQEPERGFSDIYTVYLMALSLGFLGKYRGRAQGGRIDELRRRLFLRIYHRKPQPPGDSRRLFANCYEHTLDLGDFKKLPSPGRWFLALAVAVILWIGISTLVWQSLTGGLEADLSKIRTHAARISAGASAAGVPDAGPAGQ